MFQIGFNLSETLLGKVRHQQHKFIGMERVKPSFQPFVHFDRLTNNN